MNQKREGVLGLSYAGARKSNLALKYRLNRRSKEAIKVIKKYKSDQFVTLLDLGTADAAMLNRIKQECPNIDCLGVEFSLELVQLANQIFPQLNIIQGDVENLRGIKDNSFDVVIAAALIEHVRRPVKVFAEVYRVLKNDGIFIVTSPDPFWEKMAKKIGHLKDENHQNVMSLKELMNLTAEFNFSILETKKFMISPVGFPLETLIERILRVLHLDRLMANQLLVIKKW